MTQAELQNWLIEAVAEMLERPAEGLDPSLPFSQLGLDSSEAVALTGALEDRLGQELEPTLAFEYPSIEKLSHYLAETDTAN